MLFKLSIRSFYGKHRGKLEIFRITQHILEGFGQLLNLKWVMLYLAIRIGAGYLLADQLGFGKLKPYANEEPKKFL